MYYKIDGATMPGNLTILDNDRNDLDSEASGRGEDGIMQRDVIRFQVQTFSIEHKMLTGSQVSQILSAIRKSSFNFTLPLYGTEQTFSCYSAKQSIQRVAVISSSEEYYDISFNVIQN